MFLQTVHWVQFQLALRWWHNAFLLWRWWWIISLILCESSYWFCILVHADATVIFSFHFYSLIHLIIQSFITVFVIKRCDFGVLTKMELTRWFLAWIVSWLLAICSQSWLFILFIQCSRSKADKLISLHDQLHNVEQFHFKLTWQIWIWNRQTLFEMIVGYLLIDFIWQRNFLEMPVFQKLKGLWILQEVFSNVFC